MVFSGLGVSGFGFRASGVSVFVGFKGVGLRVFHFCSGLGFWAYGFHVVLG